MLLITVTPALAMAGILSPNTDMSIIGVDGPETFPPTGSFQMAMTGDLAKSFEDVITSLINAFMTVVIGFVELVLSPHPGDIVDLLLMVQNHRGRMVRLASGRGHFRYHLNRDPDVCIIVIAVLLSMKRKRPWTIYWQVKESHLQACKHENIIYP